MRRLAEFSQGHALFMTINRPNQMTLIDKNTRRDFLKVGALATAAALLPRTNLLAAPATQHAGLQLYTLRNELAKDVEGTLQQVAKIGYKEVELFGYNGKFFGKTAAEMKALLKGLNLSVPSGHYTVGKTMKGKGTLLDGWKQAVDDAATLGQKYMVCAYLFPDERTKLDDYKEYADLFNKSAEVCKSAGIQFCYHNHDFEFKEMDGQLPYDLLLKNTDSKLVKLELDLYWATFAGQDPVALFKKSPGRYPLWHVKDMEKGGDRTFAPVGTGSIDFQRIFDAKKTAGMTHYFVEQDQTKGPALEAIATSYKNLGKLSV